MKKILCILIAFLLAAPAALAYETGAPGDYVAGFDFEGGSLNDLNGNYTGVLSNGNITVGTGYRGYGLESAGSGNAKMYVENLAEELSDSSAVTVTGWFYLKSLPANNAYRFFYIINPLGTVGISALIQKESDGGKIRIEARGINNGAAGTLESVNTDEKWTAVDEWHHFAFVLDLINEEAGNAAFMGIYIDGVKVKWSNAKLFNSLKSFSLGNNTADGFRILGNSSSENFDGMGDDIFIYNRRLSDNEIKAIASVQRSATKLSKFEAGGVDMTSLEGVLSAEGAKYKSEVLPLYGVEIALTDGSNPQTDVLILNGDVILKEDYPSLVIDEGDELIYELAPDFWEGDAEPETYRIIFEGTGTGIKNFGFFKNGARLSVLEAGEITASAKVLSEEEGTARIILVLRDKNTGRIEDLSVKSAPFGETVKAVVTVPEEYSSYELEAYLADGSLKSLANLNVLR